MVRADRTPAVGLGARDDAALEELVAHAVPDTALEDVMPVTPGPAEWTSARLEAFIEFIEARRLGGTDKDQQSRRGYGKTLAEAGQE